MKRLQGCVASPGVAWASREERAQEKHCKQWYPTGMGGEASLHNVKLEQSALERYSPPVSV